MDRAGNLYGTTAVGGHIDQNCGFGCGTVFKLEHRSSAWILVPLYAFTGPDGTFPTARVVFGPDGTLYGTTSYGGAANDGTVFRLRPPATACKAVLCPWTETVLHSFSGGSDGENPDLGDLVFDQAGNVYGTTFAGGGSGCNGGQGCGTVYELSPAGSGWTENVLYRFQGNNDGAIPYSGLALDNAGNLYGTTVMGGTDDAGTVYKLTHSASGWTESIIHNFSYSGDDGQRPFGELLFDTSGNLYGTTYMGGLNGGGTAYELTPSSGGWTSNVLYAFTAIQGSYAELAMDSVGNLYGTLNRADVEVFRLTPSDGQWTLTGFNGYAGNEPFGNVIFDASGNL